jgi:hypothetical protein
VAKKVVNAGNAIENMMGKLLNQDPKIVAVRLKVAQQVATREKLEQVDAIFAEIDTDGGGTLDLQEFQTAMSRFDSTITLEDATTMFNLADSDGNGTLVSGLRVNKANEIHTITDLSLLPGLGGVQATPEERVGVRHDGSAYAKHAVGEAIQGNGS